MLTRLSLAWSRDGEEKTYVQDRMRENGAELWKWLEAAPISTSAATPSAWPRMSSGRSSTSPRSTAGSRPRRWVANSPRGPQEGRPQQADVPPRYCCRPSPAAVAPPSRTTCPYCGVGCGVLATPDGGGAGDRGRSRASRQFRPALLQGLGAGRDPRRSRPPAPSEIATARRARLGRGPRLVAGGFAGPSREHGPDSVAFYVSGQLLTEDYYVANKLMKGFIGTAACRHQFAALHGVAVAGHRRAFGSDTVPGCYEDLDEADLIVLVGSNTAWCHPILFRRMVDARRRAAPSSWSSIPAAPRPARRPTCSSAIGPAPTRALFSGLLVHLADNGALDRGFVDAPHGRLRAALDRARAIAPTSRRRRSRRARAEADIAALLRPVRRRRRGSSRPSRRA